MPNIYIAANYLFLIEKIYGHNIKQQLRGVSRNFLNSNAAKLCRPSWDIKTPLGAFFINNLLKGLSKQCEYCLWELICLCEDGGSCLLDNLRLASSEVSAA